MNNFLQGNKKSQKIASEVFTVLISRIDSKEAKEATITYKELADKVKVHHRALYWTLGFIGTEIERLSKETGEDIPMIQALVVNSSTRIPGKGICPFIKDKSAKNRQEIFEKEWIKISNYKNWDKLLR